MSGFEVIGLVLAIVPIFEAASGPTARGLEHARTAFSSSRAGSKLEDFYVNFHYELSLLQMAIGKLVSELGGLLEDEKVLLKQGSGKMWEDPRMIPAIEDRLGVGYKTFELHITKLLEQLDKLVTKDETVKLSTLTGVPVPARTEGVYLKLQQLRDQHQNGKPFQDLVSRIRFTLKDEKRTLILQKIVKYNKKIAHLLDFSASQAPSQEQTRPASKKAHHVQILRPLMHNLYQTMGKLWPCECPLPHRARLCLLQCPEQGSTASDSPSSKVYYNMLMSIQEDASAEYCSWLESKICVSLDSDSPKKKPKVQFVSIQAPSTRPTPEPTPPSSPDQLSRSLTGLTLCDSPPLKPVDSSPPSSPVQLPSPSTSALVRVNSICKDLKRPGHPMICPQLHFDGDVLWHMRPSRGKLFVEASLPSRSLAELLREERSFNLRERRILAVILAHSLLHFCDSPWLSRHWDKKHLEFFHRSSKGGKLDLTRPWLATDFDMSEPPDDIDRFVRIHPNPSVLALGILLLEIETRSSIETHRLQDDFGVDGKVDCNTDYFTADRLLQEKIDDMYDGYKKAVAACLTCDFVEHGKTPSLDDHNFRQSVYENIVEPLEAELFHGYGLKPENLGLEQA